MFGKQFFNGIELNRIEAGYFLLIIVCLAGCIGETAQRIETKLTVCKAY